MQLQQKPQYNYNPRTDQLKLSKINFLVVIAIGLSGASLFIGLISLLSLWSLGGKAVPTMVQLDDGFTVEVDYKDPTYRSEAVVREYVIQTLTALMSMTSFNPNENRASVLDDARQLAEPVIISYQGRSGRITQSAWLASQTLEPKFAETFRWKLAQITPRDVFEGKEEVILSLDYVLVKKPSLRRTALGLPAQHWDVEVIGNLKAFRRDNGRILTTPFNKSVTVKAIATPRIKGIEDYGPIAATINRINQSGLQIVNMKDLPIAEVFED